MSKTYICEHVDGHTVFTVKPANGRAHPLRHVVFHSPTGMEFGYGGSGPADAALSILADYYGERPTTRQVYRGKCKCWRRHQAFKFAFLGRNASRIEITTEEISEWLLAQDNMSEVLERQGSVMQ